MNRTKRTSERMFSFFVGRGDIRTATGALRPGNDRFYMGCGANGPSGTPAPTDAYK